MLLFDNLEGTLKYYKMLSEKNCQFMKEFGEAATNRISTLKILSKSRSSLLLEIG